MGTVPYWLTKTDLPNTPAEDAAKNSGVPEEVISISPEPKDEPTESDKITTLGKDTTLGKEETTTLIQPSVTTESTQIPRKDALKLPYGETPKEQPLNDPSVEPNTKFFDGLEKRAIDGFTEHKVTSIV